MSKADTLGSSSAFGAARTVRSARRDLINQTLGGEQTAAEAVTELPLTVISDNPDNPRDHLRNLDETVQNVREVGVLLPIIVATADAYLTPRPDRATDLEPGAKYVVIDGHRRLEAARRVGMATIPVRVDNARVATDEALLEAAFVANYHRDDMTDLEEATALKSLVDFYGSQTKASKRLGMPQSQISSKLSLLKLAPDLQADLLTGKRTVEHVRNLGKLSADEQRQKADERAQAAAARAEAQRARVPVQEPKPVPQPSPAAGPADYHGVIIPEEHPTSPSAPPASPRRISPPAPGENPPRFTAVNQPGPTPPVPVAPERRSMPAPAEISSLNDGSEGKMRRFPYEDSASAGMHLSTKMSDDVFLETIAVMYQEAIAKGLTPPCPHNE